MRHCNNAYPLNNYKRTRRKNERKNPKPWLENACTQKKNYTINLFMLLQPKIKLSTIKTNQHLIAKLWYRKKYFHDYNDNSRKQWQILKKMLNRRKSNIRVNKLIDKNDDTAGESYKEFLRQPVENELCLSNVSPHEVHKVVKNFKNKSTLDTKISALKIANNSLNFTSILSEIINNSFNEGVLLQQLKTARVVPIFKEGSKTDVGNYRPISLLSSISKNFEKLMYNRIMEMEFLNFNGSMD